MNYPAIPLFSFPNTSIPEKGIPGWIFTVILVFPLGSESKSTVIIESRIKRVLDQK